MAEVERRYVSPERKLALAGMGMFARVSKEYPSNFVSQGAKTAILCREKELNPLRLQAELLGDFELISRLTDLANEHHQKYGLPEILPQRVARQVSVTYTLASRLLHLEAPVIERLCNQSKRTEFMVSGGRLMEEAVTPRLVEEVLNTPILAKF